MAEQFEYEILIALFEGYGLDFEEWVNATGYDPDTWTDAQIYSKLPDDLLPWLGEFDIHASWKHEGL